MQQLEGRECVYHYGDYRRTMTLRPLFPLDADQYSYAADGMDEMLG